MLDFVNTDHSDGAECLKLSRKLDNEVSMEEALFLNTIAVLYPHYTVSWFQFTTSLHLSPAGHTILGVFIKHVSYLLTVVLDRYTTVEEYISPGCYCTIDC